MVGVSWNSGYWRQIRKYPLPNCLISLLYLHLLRGAVGWGGGALGGRQTSGHNVPYSLPCHLWHLFYRGAAPFSSLLVEDWPGLVFSLWLLQFLGSKGKKRLIFFVFMLYKQIFQPCNGGKKTQERADTETAVGVYLFIKIHKLHL